MNLTVSRHGLVVMLTSGALVGLLAACASSLKCGIGACSEDLSLASEVQRRLSQHSALQPPNLLTVQVHNRIVYLYGLLDTELEREIAESVVRETPGVAKVVDSIGLSGNR